ncbi:MAG: SurA N-terminal domain-containing protein [Candidatus Omnitrophica bacterium]|nr:SurA N-terminal domain-containing protein [Candidatus Omnitrophota bacterium]
MLKQLRNRKTMKRLLWATIFLILLPFVFWGVSAPLRSKGPDYAGMIFGRKVSFEEYTASWQAARNQALLMYGSRLDEVYDSLNLDAQAWDRLILLAEAKKKRIRVADPEVIDIIKKFPFLQSGGQFDMRAYGMILEQVFKTTPRQFEEEIRQFLAISKTRDSIIKDIKLTNREVWAEYARENEKSRISYILVPREKFKNRVRFDEKTVKARYNQSSDLLRVPDQVNCEYLGFEFMDYRKDVQAADEEIKSYYETHKDEFDPKKTFADLKDTIRSSLIERKAREKALRDAEKIDYALLDKTKTLEEAAGSLSMPIKETGFFAKDGPIPQIGWFPEIQKVAFKLKPGERSELIKSRMDFVKGYYIIRVKESRASYVPPLDEVREKVENMVREDTALQLASTEAGRLHRKILELMKASNIGFEDAAVRIMREPKQTVYFGRNDYVQGIGLAGEIGEAAFDIEAQDPAPVVKTRAGYCVFKAVDLKPADQKKFKRERKEFAKKTLESKKMDTLNTWYRNLLKRANLKNNLPPA